MDKAQTRKYWQAFTPKLIILWRDGQLAKQWRPDLLAGLTVAIVALPLAMALGIASGATPSQGLVSAVVGGFLVSLLGGSRVQIGGPTGAFVVIVAGVITVHGYAGLLLATLLAGVMLIAAGYAGLGRGNGQLLKKRWIECRRETHGPNLGDLRALAMNLGFYCAPKIR